MVSVIPEFIDFCQELFPCIDPYTKEQAKCAMEQFEKTEQPFLTKCDLSSALYQGDVFSEIPFFYIGDNGQQKMIKCKAQLLSNTCDASRDNTLIFAALHPLDDFKENPSIIDAIKKNKRYSAFYLRDNILSDDFIDFEMINTFSRDAFTSLITAGKVKRIASLSLVGYYMFLCKLTIFLMRPEDIEATATRA